MLLIKLGPYLKVGYIIKSSTHNKNEIKKYKNKTNLSTIYVNKTLRLQ